LKRLKHNKLPSLCIAEYPLGGEDRGKQPVEKLLRQRSRSQSVIFVEQEKYLDASLASSAGLVICSEAYAGKLGNHNLLLVDKPYFALMKLVSIWLHLESHTRVAKIHPTAVISPEAVLAEGVSVGAYSVIEAGARIDKGTVIASGCQIGKNVNIGTNCHLYPAVTIYEDCILMDRVVLHSGVVIGADGFGFLLDGGKQIMIPQIGNVIINNDVEIGANSAVDRGTIGSTIIGEGTKIDNLVQIGHNCIIGKHSILCAQVGLAGSTIVGDYVYLAGQVGAAGHIKIGDRAMIGAQSGISNDIPEDARCRGYPARDAGLMKRIMAAEMSLPDMYKAYRRSLKKEGD
jgi:UDP-3-O-[3-hydroxymyristoyl] glucosamine N-acyltransferase